MTDKFDKDLRNQELPYTMDLSSKSDTLLITFAGISGALGIFPFEFFKITRGFNIDRIFIRDFEQTWYHHGMQGISQNIDGTIAYIQSVIQMNDYKKVVCLGNSMGGYIALIVGVAVNADVVHAFSPQTFLDSENRKVHHDNRWEAQISRIPEGVDEKYLDLSLFYGQKSIAGEINIYYSLDERIDVVHAENLKCFDYVNLVSFKHGGHQLVQQMKKNGELYRLLRNSLSSFSADRIISVFHEIKSGHKIEEACKRNQVEETKFLEYQLIYQDEMKMQGMLLDQFFNSIRTYINQKTQFRIVDDKIINRRAANEFICINWFGDEKNRIQMIGTYIDFFDSSYLLHVEVATNNLHFGFVKYVKKNEQIEIIKMNDDDFNYLKTTYRYLCDGESFFEERNWGGVWYSVDLGDYTDLSKKVPYETIINFRKSFFFRNYFYRIIKYISENKIKQQLIDKYIFTPGPVRMYPDTLQLGAIQTPYFRNEVFSEVILECESILLDLVNAPVDSRVIFIAASGTAGMEATVQNLLNQDDEVLVVNGGGFGQRFVEICQCQKLKFSNYIVSNDNLEDTSGLDCYSHSSALLINAHETSVGLLYDLESVGQFCKQQNMLNIVDAISLFVTDQTDMQKYNIDALIISSHKGLALPPGLTLVILAPKAIAKIKPQTQIYFDFNQYLSNGTRGQTPFTPAITIILQLHSRLKQIQVDGIELHINKAKDVACYFREQIKPLPLKAYSRFMPNAMTTLMPTDGRPASHIVESLNQYFNVVVTPNGGDLKETVFRVSHMGNMDRAYTDILINALFEYYGMER